MKMTDTAMLRKEIEASGLKYSYIADKMGLTPYGLQRKVDNLSEFKASEILSLSSILNLSERKRNEIFFAVK